MITDELYNQYVEELQRDISLEITDLGRHSLIQASLFLKWANRATEAVYERDRSKNKVTVERSLAELEYREHPPEGIKITVDTVQALVNSDEDVQKAEQDYLKLVKFASEMLNAKGAMEQKRDTIKVTKDLYVTGYWGTDPISNTKDMENEFIDREVGQSVGKTLLKRSKKDE